MIEPHSCRFRYRSVASAQRHFKDSRLSVDKKIGYRRASVPDFLQTEASLLVAAINIVFAVNG